MSTKLVKNEKVKEPISKTKVICVSIGLIFVVIVLGIVIKNICKKFYEIYVKKIFRNKKERVF